MSGRDWRSEHAALADLVERQLFFIGGPPRSGTTWLQQIMNAHPDVSCMGEGLFQRHLADPLDKMIQSWGQALTSKNTRLFGHSGGYPLPPSDEADFLLRIAILRALGRQTGASTAQALGEKTPENVFLFPRLQRLFPRAKFIAIFRDPRDVLSSAWPGRWRSQDELPARRTALDQRRRPRLAQLCPPEPSGHHAGQLRSDECRCRRRHGAAV
jgi:hypothetical protein